MNASTIKQTGTSLLRTRAGSSHRVLTRKCGERIAITESCHSSTRRWFGSKSPKKPKLKLATASSASPEALWCTSATANMSSTATAKPSLDMGRYGLKRLDYTTMKPPVWTAPPHPPTKTTAERVVFPFSLAVVAGIALWVYLSPEEEDMTEYWKRVESGQILLDDDDDDDWEDDEDDE